MGIGNSDPKELVQIGDYSSLSNNYLKIATAGVNADPVQDRFAGIKLRHYDDTWGATIESLDGQENAGLFFKMHNNDSVGQTAMVINRGGNVGIGTETPNATLHIAGTLAINGDNENLVMVGTDGHVGIGAEPSGEKLLIAGGLQSEGEFGYFRTHPYFTPGNGTALLATFAAEGNGPQIRFFGARDGFMDIGEDNLGNFVVEGNDNIFLTVDTTGNVGIGTSAPTHPLEMASGAHVTAGGVWTNASSRSLKENITELSSGEAFGALSGLNPVKYNYLSEKNESYVGFIAEDVPEVVAMNDRKSLSAMDIVALLTKVVQEQQKSIEGLSNELEQMKQKLNMK